MSINFNGRVALVTGAGRGLGRSHALDLARHGAKVVVNDLGVSLAGAGAKSDAADSVVEEIRRAGGEAMASYASVADRPAVEKMMSDIVQTYGRIDILVNNAGFLRDRSIAKMSDQEFDDIIDVHLRGPFLLSRAAWPHMRDQNFGRIIMTTSGTGLFGNFGQVNYGAAKLGQVGMMLSMKLEGARTNIRTNVLCPSAYTRMAEGLVPEDVIDMLTPEKVTAALLFLASDDAPNGEILLAAAGFFARARIVSSDGVVIAEPTADRVAVNWEQIASLEQVHWFDHVGEEAMRTKKRIEVGG